MADDVSTTPSTPTPNPPPISTLSHPEPPSPHNSPHTPALPTTNLPALSGAVPGHSAAEPEQAFELELLIHW